MPRYRLATREQIEVQSCTKGEIVRVIHTPHPTRDITGGCSCRSEGHALLRIFIGRKMSLVSDCESKCPALVRHTLRRTGLIILVEGVEGGWKRGMWTATLTAAGLRHAAEVAGSPTAMSASTDAEACMDPMVVAAAVEQLDR